MGSGAPQGPARGPHGGPVTRTHQSADDLSVETSTDETVADQQSAPESSGTPDAHGQPRWIIARERWKIRLLLMITAFQRWQARAPRVIAFLRIVYYPIALSIVGYIAYSAMQEIPANSLRYGPLVVAYLFALVWWSCLAIGWSTLTTEKVQIGPVSTWCRTQVARYFPGGFWGPVARATTVQGRVRNKVVTVTAENVIVLCVALGIGGLWASVHNPLWLPLAIVALAPLAGIGILERRSQITRRGVIRTGIVYAIGFICYGLSGVFSQIAFSGVHDPTYPLYVAGASCVAWAVGLVVVFAPGGVGVREVVYIWMLSGLSYSNADLKGAAIASRLVSILAELTVLAVVTRPRLHRRAAAASAAKAASTSAAAVSEAAAEADSSDACQVKAIPQIDLS
jgi:glycosyltransferase 2 family protein